ncbi:MAG: YCF48-related protein [Terracidiphilus sp.]
MSTTEIPGAPDDLVRVFVSYAREDRRWLDPDYRFCLIPFLMESLRRHRVVFWFDKELKPGDEFGRLILSQIEESQIALLIVSQNFLNSEFIESREMPRIAERARLGQMIVVPVLVEPCDWSEYPFLADRQMVPSSPLIDYTESEPQWAKVRFQILDGLKAQLKRIREAPQSHVERAQTSGTEEIPSALETTAELQALEMTAATPVISSAAEQNADPLKQTYGAKASEPVFQPPTPAGAASADRTMISTAGREKARNPFKRVIAFAAGAILVIAIVLLAIYMSHGKPWTARTSGTSAYLESIFGASDGKHLWAVGVNGTILESDDGGATWAARLSGTTNILTSIVGASDGERLWAVGEKGTILESVDGGASWTAHESPTTGDLQFVFRKSDGKRVWAVGWKGAILESDDGGANWLLHYSRTVVYFNSAFGTSDDDRFWAVGDGGAIVESDEQGEGWTVRNSGTPYRLRSIFGIWDGSRLWAVGENGTIVESDDGGVTWKAGNSGSKNDLYSIFGTGDGQQLWIVGDKGTILESLDGGASWKARNSGTKETLQSISGTSDGQHLWAVGANGTILELDR